MNCVPQIIRKSCNKTLETVRPLEPALHHRAELDCAVFNFLLDFDFL